MCNELFLFTLNWPHPLQEMGIPVKADLPVGYNLQDHIGSMEPNFLIPDRTLTFDPLSLLRPSLYRNYFKQGTGLLALPPSIEGIAFGKTGHSNESWPDYFIGFTSTQLGASIDFTAAFLNLNLEQVP